MPNLYVIGGPNGAGKTTAAFEILPELGCVEFVNADLIAAGLSPFNPEAQAITAGRLLLTKIKDLAHQQKDFAFESTLASKSFYPFLKQCKANGYKLYLIYFMLSSVDIAIKRVRKRVELGGHNIPEQTIKRRYERSLNNLISLYIPITDEWLIYNNSIEDRRPELMMSNLKNG